MDKLLRRSRTPLLSSSGRSQRELFVDRSALPTSIILGLVVLVTLIPLGVSQDSAKTSDTSETSFVKFTDVTSTLGVNFQYLSSHTSRKYLLETMGSGVALFDYDNDGRLDIFLINAAALSDFMPT